MALEKENDEIIKLRAFETATTHSNDFLDKTKY